MILFKNLKIHKLTIFNTFDPLANCAAERQVLGIRVVHHI